MRFSIRDLLWATLVVAMGLAWWVDRRQLMQWHKDEMTRAAETLAPFHEFIKGKKFRDQELREFQNKMGVGARGTAPPTN